jgi:hypothetical protein
MTTQQIDFFLITTAFKKEHPVILWLDDERDPNGSYYDSYDDDNPNKTWVEYITGKTNRGNWEVVWVKNYKEFVAYIETAGIPDVVCFDHDLGEQKTGMDCAWYLVDTLVDCNSIGPAVRSQSYNPGGAASILNLFNGWHTEWLKRNPDKNPIK